MKTLSRYLWKQNLFLMGTILFAGVGIYLLSDLFDRLDDFLEAGLGAGVILEYFVVKSPLMISQILPAVFLIACIVQLSIMTGNRELLALQAGGISFGNMIRFFVVCGLFWFAIQLVFSQFVGVHGERASRRIWKEQVRSVQIDNTAMDEVWFREGRFVVEMGRVWPRRGVGKDITVHLVSPDGLTLERIIRAKTFRVEEDAWLLSDVDIFDPASFAHEKSKNLRVDIRQDLAAFSVADPGGDPSSLPLWELGHAIDRLRESGSNVEALSTTWHMKLAYAFSVLVMGLMALALASHGRNVYLNIAAGLVGTFVFYALFMLGVSAGQKGLFPPELSVWAANALFLFLSLTRLAWHVRPRG